MRNMGILIASVAIVTMPSAALAEKKPKPTALEVQQMQSRDLETSKNVAFSAVMSVLQDEGYRVGSADKDTGLITGTASTESKTTWLPFVGFGKKKRTPVVSAYIEEIGPNVTRVRLNFVMGKYDSSQYGSDAGEKPILDAMVYQDAFEKIQKAVFVRQALDAKPAATSEAQPAAAVN